MVSMTFQKNRTPRGSRAASEQSAAAFLRAKGQKESKCYCSLF